MTETFYDRLGVSEDATTDEIESAYRNKLKETHPDVNDDEDAGEATQALIEARDVLVDDDERARYDSIGHDSYVGTGANAADSTSATDAGDSTSATDAGDSTSATDSGDATSATDSTRTTSASRSGQRNRSRAYRERRARERVRTDSSDTADATTASKGRQRTNGVRQNSATSRPNENIYSVNMDVSSPTDYRQLFPRGHQLTLLVLFFVLYPLLVFSALFPLFPLFVNLVVGGCTLLLIGYLQSMPRISVPLFGGWSLLAVFGLLVFDISFFSLVGLVTLCGTVLPFGFSALTASILRF